MANARMMGLGQVRSAIRDLFEYGAARAAEIGKENVFDFSIGNPSVPAPDVVNETIHSLLNNENSVNLHGYSSAAGFADVKQAIAEDINRRFDAGIRPGDLYMTCGAAASLTISLSALCESPEDEFIAIAPYFAEYKVFVETTGAKFVAVEPDTEKYMINLPALAAAITPHTRGVIINTPNNPTGSVLDAECIEGLVKVLKEGSEKIGHPIFIIADEPYRELVFDENIKLPYFPNVYDHTVVCYSFSKSLSLPGERIGYIVVPPKAYDHDNLFAAVAGAGRALGFVCAPSLMQKVVKSCLGQTSDINIYKTNRDLLYNALTEYGYECVRPDGAFYLFVKAFEPDAKAFSERAKQFELLLVPSDSFGCTGYVRLAYCVSTEMIKKSLPAFKALAESYKNC